MPALQDVVGMLHFGLFLRHKGHFSCFVHCMTQSRQINDPDNRFGITAFTTLAQATLINEAPLRLKLRSVNLGVVDSFVPFAISIGSPDSAIYAQSLRYCVLLFPKSSLGIFWLLCQSPDCVRVQTQRRFQPSLIRGYYIGRSYRSWTCPHPRPLQRILTTLAQASRLCPLPSDKNSLMLITA